MYISEREKSQEKTYTLAAIRQLITSNFPFVNTCVKELHDIERSLMSHAAVGDGH